MKTGRGNHPGSAITVVIADRDRARRAACLRLLELEKGIRVLEQARSSLEVLAAARLHPRVLLLDLSLSGGRAAALLPALRRRSPVTKVILIAGRTTSESRILEALCRGARGYLDSRVLRSFLPTAVRVVDAGLAWVPRTMLPRMVDRLARLANAAQA
jgi:two-component system response regulator NreC